jgi:glyoxylase-like metal-dependent hydrolase (beta-lactamase superfamily II)
MSLGDGVTRIRESHVDPGLRCNIWHLEGRDRDLLIDSGLGLRSLREEVASLRERPMVALASHCHFDHVGAHHEFEERWIHPSEAEVLRAPTAENTVWADCQGLLKLSALPFADFDPEQYRVAPAPPTRLIDEGDEVDLGNRLLKVFHLPGHSPGSVCLYEARTRTLYTGDVVYDGELFDFLYHSDIEQYLESMARLKEIPAEVFHCGHFESFGRARLVEIVDAYVSDKLTRPPAGGR